MRRPLGDFLSIVYYWEIYVNMTCVCGRNHLFFRVWLLELLTNVCDPYVRVVLWKGDRLAPS